MIRCRTLGPPLVELDGGAAAPELTWRKHFALLVYLARSPRLTRPREHLVELLWGDKPESAARHSLNEALRLIRRYAGDDAVTSDGAHAGLRDGIVRLDVADLAAAAASGRWADAAALVGGEFLEGVAVAGAERFEEWLAVERAEWQRVGVEALVRRSAELAEAAAHQDALAVARAATALAPRSEVAARAFLRALALSGRRDEALGWADIFTRRLQADLAAAPEAETAALIRRIQRGDAGRARPDPAPRTIPVPLPIVGRGPALERLAAALAAARTGSRATLCVVEAGVGLGRTRLLEETAGRCRLDGWTVAAARAVPADLRIPWSAVGGLLHGGLLDAEGLPGASPEALAAIMAAAHVASSRLGPMPPSAMHPASALSEALASVADEAPVLLILDDAMWADAESLAALGRSLRDLAARPLVLVLSVRTGGAPSEVDELRAHLGREIAGCVLRLETLDAAAVRELAAHLLPGYDAEQLDRIARRVTTDSAGSPLFAAELLRAIGNGIDLGRLAVPWPAPDRTLDQTFPAELPDAVVAAVRVNFRRLSPEAQAVLAAAAVLPERNAEEALGRAAALDPPRASAALDEAEAERWLLADARGYTFAARVVRDVIARDMLTPGQRRRILARMQ